MHLSNRGRGNWFVAVIVGLGVGAANLTTNGCGDGKRDTESKQSAISSARRPRLEELWALIPFVPPLSFTGATFTDSDDARDVVSVALYTWAANEQLPTDRSDPDSWTGKTPIQLTPISETPTWTTGDVKLGGVVALAFVVVTHPPGDTKSETTTVNFTQVAKLAEESIGLAESRITAGNAITNRILVGRTDANGPLGIYIAVDANRER